MAAVMDPATKMGEQRETGWVSRLFSKEASTPEYQELKFTLHRKLLDRINLEALSSMSGERVRAEVRTAVARLVDEEKTPLSLVEKDRVEIKIAAQGIDERGEFGGTGTSCGRRKGRRRRGESRARCGVSAPPARADAVIRDL